MLNPKDRKQRSTKILGKEDKQKIKAKRLQESGNGREGKSKRGREGREGGREGEKERSERRKCDEEEQKRAQQASQSTQTFGLNTATGQSFPVKKGNWD